MEATDKDITGLVEFGDIDEEILSLTKCACGRRFTHWDFILNIYRDMAHECPACGRKMYFSYSVRVYEVTDSGKELKNEATQT